MAAGLDLDELERIARAATGGPWTVETMRPHTLGPAWVNASEVSRIADCGDPTRIVDEYGNETRKRCDEDETEANAVHIATFDPPTVLAILDRLRKAERAVAEMREALVPFAMIGRHDVAPEEADKDIYRPLKFCLVTPIVIGDLRRAARVVERYR